LKSPRDTAWVALWIEKLAAVTPVMQFSHGLGRYSAPGDAAGEIVAAVPPAMQFQLPVFIVHGQFL
jgi:ABC-type anion transport system duplicated permease subunit